MRRSGTAVPGPTSTVLAILLACGSVDILVPPAAAQSSGPVVEAEVPREVRDIQLRELPAIPGFPPDAEILFVSGREPEVRREGEHGVRVLVDRPGETVVLILSSSKPIFWEVEATSSTTVAQVLVAGSDSTLHSRLPLQAYRAEIPSPHMTASRDFTLALQSLRDIYRIDGIDHHAASYRIPATVKIRDLDYPDPRLLVAWPQAVAPLEAFQFSLPTPDLTSGDWSATGPIDVLDSVILAPETVAFSPDGYTAYRIGDDAIEIVSLFDGSTRSVPIPPNFARFSWPEGIAYDTRNDIVAFVTSGGGAAGAFYRFDARAERWRDYRELARTHNIESLGYDPVSGQYVAAGQYDPALFFLSAEGEYVEVVELDESVPGLYRTFVRGNGGVPALSVVAHGDQIAMILVHPPVHFTRMEDPRQVLRIWLYERDTGEALLTYRQSCSDLLPTGSRRSTDRCVGGL